jgi:hypothetical protein
VPSKVSKDPDDIIDYQIDFTNWLADGDTISSSTVSAPAGITLVSSSNNTTAIAARLSGGTLGTTYVVPCQATLADGQKITHTLVADIRSK